MVGVLFVHDWALDCTVTHKGFSVPYASDAQSLGDPGLSGD